MECFKSKENVTTHEVTTEQKKHGVDNLSFPEFNSIKVSTKTFIVMTNMKLNIDKLFDYLPLVDYILVPKRRGRKKKNEPADPNIGIESGSIITLEYQGKIRGVDLKKKKKKNKDNKNRGNYFRNSVTVVMMIDSKKVNFKVSRNGKFQMTGCKHDSHAEECVKWIWKYIKNSKSIWKFEGETDYDSDSDSDEIDEYKTNRNIVPNLKAIFIPAMRNIDFGLGFFVDREKLDAYFNTCTDYHSLLETSFGYTGVNIKIPVVKPIRDLMLKQIECVNGLWIKPVHIPFSEYLNMLPDKDVAKKLNKERFNTFLVFHSGKVIMSGMEATFMKDVYYEFLDIIRDCYDTIEERLDYV
jgi:TATA-box binding protein (TBP) (component of TFIID and TFIIIB)